MRPIWADLGFKIETGRLSVQPRSEHTAEHRFTHTQPASEAASTGLMPSQKM